MLADPAAYAGMTHVLTGPQDVTYADRRCGDRPSSPASAWSTSPSSQASTEARLLAAGLPTWRAFDLAHIAAAYAGADHDVSPALGALLGREPRSLSDFLADHGAAFRPAHS